MKMMFFFFMRYDMTMTAFRDLGGGFGGVSIQGLGVVGGGGGLGEVFQFNFRRGQGPEEGAPHQGVGEPRKGFQGVRRGGPDPPN